MTRAAEAILRRCDLYSDERDYRLLRLPPNAIALAAGVVAEIGLPWVALLVDKDEATLMIPDEARSSFASRLGRARASDAVYRLITFEAPLDPGLVGFIARVAGALAAEGIPILTYAAYSRDHIFVPKESFDRAIGALRELQNGGERAWK